MLPLLADEHVHAAILVGLRSRGIDAQSVQEIGLTGQDDEVVLIRSTELGRVLVTNDRGFLRRDATWRADGRRHSGVVFWQLGKLSIGEAIEGLMAVCGACSSEEASGTVIYL